MFTKSEYLKRESFDKIGYVINELGFNVRELADVLDLSNDVDLVKYVVTYGDIPQTGYVSLTLKTREELFEIFYDFLMIMAYFLKITKYDNANFSDVWENDIFYHSTLTKPPWINLGLKEYLTTNKYQGLKECLDWIRKF